MPANGLRDFLRNGSRNYSYQSYNERLLARYGYEINSAFHGPDLDPDHADPAKWGDVFRRAVQRAEAAVPQPREGPRHSVPDPDQLTIPEELQWKTKS